MCLPWRLSCLIGRNVLFLVKMACVLLRHLTASHTHTWLLLALRLMAFALLLAPAWAKLVPRYFMSKNIHRGIQYGKHFRNSADVYLPPAETCLCGRPCGQAHGAACVHAGKRPVVVFVVGGAWCIGYKMWALASAMALSRLGIICVVPDYRNFPQASISGMMADVAAAVRSIADMRLVRDAGADMDAIYLVGQSAGAHISACLVLHQASATHRREPSEHSLFDDIPLPAYTPMAAGGARASTSTRDFTPRGDATEGCGRMRQRLRVPALAQETTETDNAAFAIPRLRRFVGISGAYDLVDAATHFRRRAGFVDSFIRSVFDNNLEGFSPTIMLRELAAERASIPSPQGAGALPRIRIPTLSLPPVTLYHGTCDNAVPASSSCDLASALVANGIDVHLEILEGKSHTDPILEDPLSGSDPIMRHLVATIVRDSGYKDIPAHLQIDGPSLVPRILVSWARRVNPF